MKNYLFIGWYPNPVDKYKNVFFQNLIYEIARQGNNCTVISPVSYMKYRKKIWDIPEHFSDKLSENVIVDTYYPRTISASSIQIGSFNTEHISEECFEHAALNCAKSLKRKFDCVYGHFFLYGGLAAVRIGRTLGIPSFIAYGECDFESQVRKTYGFPKKKQLDGLTGIISVSTKNTNELHELGIAEGVPIITAPNSTNLSLFYKKDKEKCREKLEMPFDKFIVGFVGGFIDRKGDKRLLEAVNRIDGAYAAFAGRGDNPPYGEKVIFCKAIEHEVVSDFINAIDVFCLPTLSEGSCNAIVEAMACGCPIISSNLPFNDDVLTDGNSIRIDPMSIEDIRNAIEKLRDESVRKKMSMNALSTAQNLSIEKRAERILDFIERTSYKM